MATQYALSVKQPWAALLVHGVKTVEVRRWTTRVRGRVLIHAARVPDDRPEALQARTRLSREGSETAQLLGGIIGVGELTGHRTYRSREEFQADQVYHLNHPSWFEPPQLHGLVFTNLRVLPFHPCPGWMRFFKMEWDEAAVSLASLFSDKTLSHRRPQLLVSVRNAAEAEAAMAGGADLIDVKEPERGPLGAADCGIVTEVIAQVAGRRPVSAALGELLDSFWKKPAVVPQLAYTKWGLAGFQRHLPLFWQWELTHAVQQLAEINPACKAVAVAYADWEPAQAPTPDEVLTLALQLRLGAFLIDTWHKDGSTLLDWLPISAIARLRKRCLTENLPMALAGSLGPAEIQTLLPLRPDWFAVRGAVCQGRRRGAAIDEGKVRQLATLLKAGNT
ncbi:MAG TPA: (5-formylfuran-3-yl)methyl phosphate synthase [Gemmataceae bacterium]|nr:(5-formylfuran-3-yl)methyl phosphate synthase [Gemmataceae bacterium]